MYQPGVFFTEDSTEIIYFAVSATERPFYGRFSSNLDKIIPKMQIINHYDIIVAKNDKNNFRFIISDKNPLI